MGPGILGNYYFGHTDVMVLDKVVNYDHHIVGAVLHIVPIVDIALGPPPLANNFHDLTLDYHLFIHRVVGVEPMAAMHAVLVEVDTLVVGLWLLWILWRLSRCVRELGLNRWDSWVLNKIHHVHLVL